MADTDLERFGSGEASEWHADQEHMRDMSAALRLCMLYSLQDDLESFRFWWNSVSVLERCVLPYCTGEERGRVVASRASRLPSAFEAGRLRLSVDLRGAREALSVWECACRAVMVAHGFAIRARPGDEYDLDESVFKKKSGLT